MCNSLVSQSKFLPASVGSRTLVAAGRTVLAVVLAAQIVACSSPAPPPAPAATQQSATPQRLDPDSFSGPILGYCRARSETTTISKLKVDTGQLATIAILPDGCNPDGPWHTKYSPDFRKQVDSTPRSDSHVLYYDSRTGTKVDVTNVVSPQPTGDFGVQTIPRHTYPQFDEQGLFVFFDINSGEYKFFDTNTKHIVRTSKTYSPQFLQQLALDPSRVGPNELPKEGNERLCDPKWIIDDTRYLRTIGDNTVGGSQGNYQLVIEPMPPTTSTRPNCNEITGQVITPPSLEIWRAAADPTGSIIVFIVMNRTNGKALSLYRANREDPDHPIPIKLSEDILDHAGALEDRDKHQVVYFIGWR
ncbi:hypothetical protein [Mycobacteroides chelonae]|uniref:hypothetical protein n=1 Tax=Mycobacteroides chelonae TaxID=1774 RepID=UPI001F160CCB|nr:hypothetical protein [Mycobacteroides chelonae]